MSTQVPVMYGIANCDTIKKARQWLSQNNIEYQFHDYKKLGTDARQLQSWLSEFGWETIINKRGTSWRKLDEATRSEIDDAKAIQLMQDNPSIIKRPILDTGKQRVVGFNEAEYQQLLLKS